MPPSLANGRLNYTSPLGLPKAVCPSDRHKFINGHVTWPCKSSVVYLGIESDSTVTSEETMR